VCARARALVDEIQEERAEIVKVAVLFVIAVRRGGEKGNERKPQQRAKKKNPFLGSISQHLKKKLEEKGELGVNKLPPRPKKYHNCKKPKIWKNIKIQ
jgi:hypothetical protein